MIVVVPTPLIVTCPFASTVATPVLDELYVTVPSHVFVSAFVNTASPYVLLIDFVP